MSLLAACGGSEPSLFTEIDNPEDLIIKPVEPGDPPTDGTKKTPPKKPPSDMPGDTGEQTGEVPLDDDGETEPDENDGEVPDEGDGEKNPDPPIEPPPPSGPSVISVFPEDGASGISAETEIVIRFSTPMNEEATERAYQSEGIPSSTVTFSWNEDSTELTITPNEPLEYDTGTDPAQVEARRYSFFLSSSAEDLEGNRLEAPEEFSFAVLRQIQARLSAVPDPDLTGNWRSDNQYGNGDCSRNTATICVGDQRTGNNNRQYKGFITFDLSDLPDDMVALSGAQLTLQITGTSGNPFGGLGDLFVEHARFDTIGAQAFSAPAMSTLGAIASQGNAGTMLSKEVLPAVERDFAERLLTQYRFVFEDATDGDNNSDAILSAWETQTLDVFYLLP